MTASVDQRDANVLLSILALKFNYVASDDLIAATHKWSPEGNQSLGNVLVQQGSLSPPALDQLQVLVSEQLQEKARYQRAVPTPAPGDYHTLIEPVPLPGASDLPANSPKIAQGSAATPTFETMVPASPSPSTGNRQQPAESPRERFETLLQPQPGPLPAPLTPSSAVLETLSLPPASNNPAANSRGSATGYSASRFKILRPHAKGGLGEVFIALDGEVRREVALKHIQDKYADDPESRQRFVSEAEITGGLEHPSIVPIYGLGTYPNGRPYYAMRFIRGSSFKRAIDRFHKQNASAAAMIAKGREFRQLLGQFVAVCNAIHYSHNRGVIHRDLKPANVMLGKYGETFVVDWGLAKMVDAPEASVPTTAPDVDDMTPETPLSISRISDASATRMGTQVGTPQFMSPEQAAGDLEKVNFASDIYCLGATLYYVLTGQAPFDAADVRTLLRNVEDGIFPPPRERNRLVPKPLEAICLRAMSLHQKDRHATAGALAEEIDCWLADEPVASYRETLVERTMRWTRRHRAWTQAIVGSVFVVAVVASISTFLINRARKNERVALGVAQQEKAASEVSFQKARKTVDQFFTSVSETKLLNVPGLQPLRQELLREALNYYQGFVEERGADPKLRAELAATFFRIGLITNAIGSKADALKSLDRALVSQRELVAADPNNQEASFALANTLNAQGDTLLAEGKYAAALAFFEQAKQERERIARQHPTDPQLQRKVLNSVFNIAAAQAQQGAKQQAIVSYLESNPVRKQLAQAHPDDPTFQLDLALGYFNLAHLQLEVDQPGDALKSLQEAEAIYRTMLDKFPANIDYAARLAKVLRIAGELQLKVHSLYQAQDSLQQAYQLARQLASSNPLVAELRHELVLVDYQRAELERLQGDLVASMTAADEALAIVRNLIQEDSSIDQYKLDLASLLKLRGQLLDLQERIPEACSAFEESTRLCLELAAQGRLSSDVQVAEHRVLWGTALVRKGDYPQALSILLDNQKTLERTIADKTDNLQAQLLLAQTNIQRGVAIGKSQDVPTGVNMLQTVIADLQGLHTALPDSRAILSELSNAHARSAELLYSAMIQAMDEAKVLPEAERAGQQPKILDLEAGFNREMKLIIDWRSRICTRPDATAEDFILWGQALQSLAYVRFDLEQYDEALALSQEALSVLQTTLKNFPADDALLSFQEDLNFQLLEFRQSRAQFAEMLAPARDIISCCKEPATLIELARRLVFASTAAATAEQSQDQSPALRLLAVEACCQAAKADPQIIESLREDKELASLKGIEMWDDLLKPAVPEDE